MKKLFFITASFLLFFANVLFSQFEASIYAPLSFTLTFPILDTKNVNVNNIKGNSSFSAGVIGNFGHKFSINDGKYSISLLTELGYYRQTFSASYYYSSMNFKDTLSFDTLLVGVMPKFNIDLKKYHSIKTPPLIKLNYFIITSSSSLLCICITTILIFFFFLFINMPI